MQEDLSGGGVRNWVQSVVYGAAGELKQMTFEEMNGVGTGGPVRGHPRLRMRHAAFLVNQAARDRWVELMARAMEEASLLLEPRKVLENFLFNTATFMINRA